MPMKANWRLQLRGLFFDAIVVLGVAAVAYGFWRAWRPLGFIIGGLFAAAAAFLFGYNPETLRRRS